MNTVFFLILRRMRAPLLLLSTVYAIATIGLTFIPGRDSLGNIWYMDFFHAFYFVSFMGTTTGFGEIPYPFTDGQRMWALVWIYFTVVAWIYAIGAVLNLLQNETLRRAFTEHQFEQKVQKIREPFFLVCGYGDTGSKLVDALERRGLLTSVIEIQQERIDFLILSNNPLYVPRLCADARDPENLKLGGICHPLCTGVVALTDNNEVNLHIAITAKVLNPGLQVICRAESHEVEANMASFGTDYIVDPFDTFADRLTAALAAPSVFTLTEWFRSEYDEPRHKMAVMPEGPWVLCGFGRFGQAIYDRLTEIDIPVIVIEPAPDTRHPPEESVLGWGTQADTLIEAGLKHAVGIIAGTHDDSNNLSIIVTAREINPELFVIARHNEHQNRAIFENCGADIVMEISDVVARKIRTHITNPMLEHFMMLAIQQNELWGAHLLSRIESVTSKRIPDTWSITINDEDAYAVPPLLAEGHNITLHHLLCSHTDRSEGINAIPLLLERGGELFSLPDSELSVEAGDQILFAGTHVSRSRQAWTLQNRVALTYVLTGSALPQSSIWRWFHQRFGRRPEDIELV